MSELEQFLALPDVDSIEEEVFVSERIGTCKVRAMTAEDFKIYQRKAGGKFTKKGTEFDTTKFYVAMIAGQTITPNFESPELLKQCNCINGEQLVSKKLLMGEIIKLASKIQEISGFGEDINEDIEDAKN